MELEGVYQSPTLGAHTYAHAHAHGLILGGHGCAIIGNITILLKHGRNLNNMGGHRSLLMGVIWV